MGRQCFLCGKETIFYIWTTSKVFPIEKLLKKIKSKAEKRFVRCYGVPICWNCYRRLKDE